tara:strand:+ start:35 stop:400 length:366 start_codon:yes stop_codon:yes gene_type:complete
MTEENGGSALVEELTNIDSVEGVVVWRLGKLPVSSWKKDNYSHVCSGMLSALTGNLEKGIEDLGLGNIDQLWWQSDLFQCVGFRVSEFQILVVASRAATVAELRTQVASKVDSMWSLLHND